MTRPQEGEAAEARCEAPIVEEVRAGDWRARCFEELGGGHFVTLYALSERGPRDPENAHPHAGPPATRRAVRAVFASRAGVRVLTCPTPEGRIPSLVDLLPAAAWAEREAHDSYGVRFDGHHPLRPLVAHPSDLAEWTLPVHGRDAYQVAVGPIHAGVIESGHFRFHVVGESILHVDVRLFYKHRGLERAAEGSIPSEGLAYAQRACGACAVSNSLAYAHACESALGLTPPPELARARTLLLELERLYNHLHDIGAACAGIGFAPGAMTFAALKERAQRVNLQLSGHRFLFGAVAVGRSDLTIAEDDAASARRELVALGGDARAAWHEVLFNASVQDRFFGVGVLPREDALDIGAVGPVARASGVARDARLQADRRLHYPRFALAALRHPTGDVSSRVNQRALEVDATLVLLDDLLARPLGPAAAAPEAPAAALGAGLVESPRGETACLVEMSAGRLTRLHLRSASFANWPALAHAAAGQLFPDFPLINKSFELCYACTDR